ncbi:MAG: hypothetical protein ACI90V_007889 [Bacillariaceae sp.]|jgi:uncharacterized protein (DUF1499 family)
MMNVRSSQTVRFVITVLTSLCMLVLVTKSVEGLVTKPTTGPLPLQLSTTTQQQQQQNHHNQLIRTTTSKIVSFVAAATILLSPVVDGGGGGVALALDNIEDTTPTQSVEVVTTQSVEEVMPTTTTTTTKKSYSIVKCDVSSKSPCVSTSNVRQLDLYVPPWTFRDNFNTDEVMATLKSAIEADPLSTIVVSSQDDDNNYNNKQLLVDSKRKNDLIGNTVDRLEFIINESDHVITLKSSAPLESTTTDFGLQRKRLEQIRDRSGGIFGVMGDTLNTADTKSTGERGNGPLGQLKSFYGLQSGGGFEDVLSE